MRVTEVLAIWVIAFVLLAPLFGSVLHKRRVRREYIAILQAAKEAEARKARLRQTLKLADAIVETDSVWQERARIAESLGFREDEEAGPWVA